MAIAADNTPAAGATNNETIREEIAKKAADAPKKIRRFSNAFLIQHIILFMSVIALIFTGFPIWLMHRPEWIPYMPTTWIEPLDWTHRVAGIVLMLICVFHTFYCIFTKDGRKMFMQFLPTPKDVKDVLHQSAFFLGLRDDRPLFGKFGYHEKFDYWAVYWGCVIMVGTGLMLMYDRVTQWLVGGNFAWTYTLALEVHGDEAILATLALFIWHFWNVHFNPRIFPGNTMIFHGMISKEEMIEEHPLELAEMLEREEQTKAAESESDKK